MTIRNRNKLMRELLRETNKCELCGSKRSLEVHHIVPVSCGGPEDDPDNMIVICVVCHAKLTPRKILTRIGLKNARYNNYLWKIYGHFYEILDRKVNEYDFLSVEDVADAFDECIKEEMRNDLGISDGHDCRGCRGVFAGEVVG